jgi:hypothetical protein
MRISAHLRWTVALGAFVALSVLAVSASGAARYESTVKIKSGGAMDFNGVVRSDHGACERHRDVVLYMDTRNGNIKEGEDTTNRQGEWNMPGSYNAGKYFAIVKKEELASGAVCLRDVSVTARF